MDNFTHSLAGWALGQAGLKTRSRKGLAALILGANAPDIDVLFGWSAWAPLAPHRGVTHSLVGGVIVLPLLLTGLLLLLDRWQAKRGENFDSGLAMRPVWLLALAFLGALTHPLLDLQNSYAVQLLSPFDPGWFHSDGLFIIDVWLWSIIAFAIWLSRRREGRGGNWRAPVIAALGLALVYIGSGVAMSATAKQALLASGAAQRPDVLVANPPPALPFRRNLVWREQQRIGRAMWNPVDGITGVGQTSPDGMSDPLARRAMTASPAIIAFMRWSIIPTAEVKRRRCDATVTFGDARYGDNRARTSFEQSAVLALTRPGCAR